MNNTVKLIIKILLVVLIIGGIALLAVNFMGGVSEAKVEEVQVTEFEKHIANRVENEIAGKSLEEADEAFNDIWAEIETESAVKNTDGTTAIQSDEKVRCQMRAFDEMAPIYLDYAENCFSRSVWDEDEVEMIQESSEALLDLDLAESGSSIAKRLLSTKTTADNYYAARRIIRNAGSCYSASALDNYISQVNKYRNMSPLNNNTALMNDLYEASTKAKRACADNIISKCYQVANNYSSYSSYESFYAEYTSVSNLKADFVSKYGNSSWFNEVSSRLKTADEKAMNYFSN